MNQIPHRDISLGQESQVWKVFEVFDKQQRTFNSLAYLVGGHQTGLPGV